MSQNAWLTVDDIPTAKTTLTITLPDSDPWLAILRGALTPLIEAENFEQFGTLTPDQMAEEWFRIFNEFLEEPPVILPVGMISPFAGAVAPAGWLLCDGGLVSRTTYADLFLAIGAIYGAGDGSTTFALPNTKGRILAGLDAAQAEFDALGEAGGSKAVTLGTTEIPAHTHVQNSHNHVQNSHTHIQDTHNHTQNAHTHIQNVHTHIQNTHNHSTPPHDHQQNWFNQPGGAGPFWVSTGGTSWKPAAAAANTGNTFFDTDPATPTNQATTPTNQNTTPTNNGIVPTNQVATAVNQVATAVNQNAGGGAAHVNLQPYLTVNYIIKF